MSTMDAEAGDRRQLADLARRLGLPDASARRLAGGSRNRSYRLGHPGGEVVVRIGGAHDPDFAVVRAAEVRAQRAAAARGLAPRVLLEIPEQGILVSEFISGGVWSREIARSAQAAASMGHWLRRLHAVPLPKRLRRVDFSGSLEHYLGRLADGRLPAALAARGRAAASRLAGPAAAVLCHNDLHHLNLIESARGLVAVDWEYAGAGVPIMDLAGFAAYHDLDEPTCTALLGAYASATPALSMADLAEARWLFEAVWLAWLELAFELDGEEPAAHAAERARLRARVCCERRAPD